MIDHVCLFLYCLTITTPIKDCDYVIGQPTEVNTSRLVDVAVKNGRTYSFCGTEKEVKNNEFYKMMKEKK